MVKAETSDSTLSFRQEALTSRSIPGATKIYERSNGTMKSTNLPKSTIERRPIYRPKTSWDNYQDGKYHAIGRLEGRQQRRPVSADNVDEVTATSHSDRQFSRPGWAILSRSVPSTSPLAQYDNGLYSFFGSNPNARVYRTPISNRKTLTRNAQFTGCKSSESASCLPTATAWGGPFDRYGPSNNAKSDGASLALSNGRKSAMRTDNNARRTPRQKLHVSFDETLSGEVVTPFGAASVPSARIARPLQRSTGSAESGFQKRDFRRRHTISSIPFVKPSPSPGGLSDFKIGGPRKCDRIVEESSNTATTSSRPSRTDSQTQILRTDLNARNMRILANKRIGNETLTYETVRSVPDNVDFGDSLMVLNADQLLVRKSVEKVQRWIAKLPQHFTTTHHILPPVQQD